MHRLRQGGNLVPARACGRVPLRADRGGVEMSDVWVVGRRVTGRGGKERPFGPPDAVGAAARGDVDSG